MKKFTRIITILLVIGLVGLAGCEEQTTKEKKALAAGQQKSTKVKQNEANKEKKVEKPVVVSLIDPTTKNVIKTIKPKDMGFGEDDEKYRAKLAELTREMARGTDDTPGYDKRMILDKLDVNGQVIKGSPQTILEEQELTDRIIQS